MLLRKTPLVVYRQHKIFMNVPLYMEWVYIKNTGKIGVYPELERMRL